MTRMTRTPSRYFSIVAILMPAAIETTTVFLGTSLPIVARTVGITCGFTVRNRISEALATAATESVTWTENCFFSKSNLAGATSFTVI